jgi:hypothetical protein
LNFITVEHEQPGSHAHALPFPKVLTRFALLRAAHEARLCERSKR